MKISNWKELKQVILNIPIEESVLIRDGELDIVKKGHQLFGLCPFHSDERQGNFAFGGPHNGFKCFACGKSGDIINLVTKLDGVSFKEALLIIARELEVLTSEEADEFKKGNSATIKEGYKVMKVQQEQYAVLDEEQINMRHEVYSLFSQGDSIVNPVAEKLGIEGNKSRLSDRHYKELKEHRGLTDEQIEEAGFFTMREDYSYLPVLYLRLFEEKGLPPNTLHVPGFWRHKDGLSIAHMKKLDGNLFNFEEEGLEEQYFWYCDPINALGIPIRNEDRKIVGIQLRPDDSSIGGKYIWFSSTYANGKNGKVDGLSAGAQQDVAFPKRWNNPHVFVTEGKFKSLTITKTFHSPSISLQGVNASKDVHERLVKLNGYSNKGIQNVLVAFDADLAFNDAVLNSMLDMAERELSDYNTYIAVWDHLFGKGIDDLIQNGYKKAIVRLSLNQASEVKELLEKHAPMPQNASKEEKIVIKEKREDFFYQWLQEIHPNILLHPERMKNSVAS